jgi:hypothetical protein
MTLLEFHEIAVKTNVTTSDHTNTNQIFYLEVIFSKRGIQNLITLGSEITLTIVHIKHPLQHK